YPKDNLAPGSPNTFALAGGNPTVTGFSAAACNSVPNNSFTVQVGYNNANLMEPGVSLYCRDRSLRFGSPVPGNPYVAACLNATATSVLANNPGQPRPSNTAPVPGWWSDAWYNHGPRPPRPYWLGNAAGGDPLTQAGATRVNPVSNTFVPCDRVTLCG